MIEGIAVVKDALAWSVGGIIGEMKMHPWTTLAALAALLLASYNFSSNARATDLMAIQENVTGMQITVNEVLAGQIEVQLLDARVRYCKAHRDGSDDQQMYYRKAVSDYISRYREVTGREYKTPNCNEV